MECMVPTVGVYPIATANDKEQISAPLMSRFAVIDIPDYSFEEKKVIFSKFSLPKVLNRMSLKEEECIVTDDALDAVIEKYADTTGIRDLEQAAEHIAANAHGDGRGVYFSALANDPDNTRLLLRALYYASHKEDNYYIWNADNINCEVHAYPESGKYAILNNSDSPQTTDVYDGNGSRETINLEPREIMWRIM